MIDEEGRVAVAMVLLLLSLSEFTYHVNQAIMIKFWRLKSRKKKKQSTNYLGFLLTRESSKLLSLEFFQSSNSYFGDFQLGSFQLGKKMEWNRPKQNSVVMFVLDFIQ